MFVYKSKITVVIFFLCLQFSNFVWGAVLQVSPILLKLSKSQPIEIFSVTNSSSENALFQTKVYDWQIPKNATVKKVITDFVVMPPIFSLKPNETKILRLEAAPELFDGTEEKQYRLYLLEVMRKTGGEKVIDNNPQELKVILHLSVPIVIEPDVIQKDFSWHFSFRDAKHLVVELENQSNVHVNVKGMNLYREYPQKTSIPLITQNINDYVLNHSKKFWELSFDKILFEENKLFLTAEISVAGKIETVTVPVTLSSS